MSIPVSITIFYLEPTLDSTSDFYQRTTALNSTEFDTQTGEHPHLASEVAVIGQPHHRQLLLALGGRGELRLDRDLGETLGQEELLHLREGQSW